MENYIIYTLSDPFTYLVKYIGITSRSLQIRLQDHWSDVHGKTYKNNWIKLLKKQKIKPLIEELDTAQSLSDAHLLEMYWIGQFKIWGFVLTNSTLGGEGGLGYKHTEGSKQKIRDFWASRPKKPKKKTMTKEEKYSKLASNLKIPILQYNLDGSFVKRWSSQLDAANYYNTRPSAIGHALRDPTRCAANFLWRKDGIILDRIDPYTRTRNNNLLVIENVQTNEINTYNSNMEAFKIIGRPTDPSLFINRDRIFKKLYKMYTK